MSRVDDKQWSQLSGLIAERIGLDFPPARWRDMKRGFAAAVQEFGFHDASACLEWLLSTRPTREQLEVLASHLTIGETYFFRERPTFDALENRVLPELIASRRGREQRLRIWSAGCCTGEEPYSLAILLHRLLPDLSAWQVTITASDVNPRFLKKAAAGVYRDWSFRNAPAGVKERYFERTSDGSYAISPQVKQMVSFEQLNLAEDIYPSLVTNTNAVDLVLCRNVLMYFTEAQVSQVIVKLDHALAQGGWLVVSPSEASHTRFPQFALVSFPGAILYRKNGDRARGTSAAPSPAPDNAVPQFFGPYTPPAPDREPTAEPAPPAPPAVPADAQPTADAYAEALYAEGRYGEAADILLAEVASPAAAARTYSLLARALANQGRLAEGAQWCERWTRADKLNSAAHYMLGVILVETGEPEQARSALERAIYLDPDFVLAHFALGNLARSRGRREEAARHFANALRLVSRYDVNEQLPDSDGLSAGRLAETLAALAPQAAVENAR